MSTDLDYFTLGGTASGIKLHKMGYGLMSFTATHAPTPDEQAFEAIKAAIDLCPPDQKLMLNSSQFYGRGPREANLHLVSRFFAKYPELTDRVFLSVKAGVTKDGFDPDTSEENLRWALDVSLKALDGKKTIDLFQCARVDKTVPLEETYKLMKQFQEQGKFTHIGISEVGSETLTKVMKLVAVVAVEIEVSPWCFEEPGQKVVELCKENGIAVIAYSPLGRGFLTGTVKVAELPQTDLRLHYSKFKPEVATQNEKLVNALTSVATRKGVTTAQLCLAWVAHLGPHVIPLPGTTKASRVKENMSAAYLRFTDDDLAEISEALKNNPPAGGRYGEGFTQHLWG